MGDLAPGPPRVARSNDDGGRTGECPTLPESAVLMEASPESAKLLDAAGLGRGPAVVWVSHHGARAWARP